MNDIRDYIRLSDSASGVRQIFANPEDFKKFYLTINSNEEESLLRHFIVNNVPFVFKEKPMLYEQLTKYVGDKLVIAASEIKLIGSAKTGFSISPNTYGKAFGNHSDLDFSIISERVFLQLENEYLKWSNLYKEKKLQPINQIEEKYWTENLETGKGQIRKGFLDPRFIPNRESFELTKQINNTMWIIQKYLLEEHEIKLKTVSASIYKNWPAFAARLKRNTSFVMNNLQKGY
jgi:hypothetical protein